MSSSRKLQLDFSAPRSQRPGTIPLPKPAQSHAGPETASGDTILPGQGSSSQSHVHPQGNGTSSNSKLPPSHYKSDIELRTCNPTTPPVDIERLKSKSMDEIGVLKTSTNKVYDFGVKDLEDMGQIGEGSFGTVNKMIHRKSQSKMAVKIIRVSVNEQDQKQVVMDLGVIKKASNKNIVNFYGALFYEGDCWICMELMDLSAEILYRYVHHTLKQFIEESYLAKLALATVQALQYLQEKLTIIHRDVKPSNILLNQRGDIKLCDFGISGVLVDSIAKTHDVGCRPYMAPERIDNSSEREGYDVRSDVWSMGIALIEIANGSFPYKTWTSVFDQLQQVVKGPSPCLKDLPNCAFSKHFHTFINSCLKKMPDDRPKYNALLKSSFLSRALNDKNTDMAGFVTTLLNKSDEIPFNDPNNLSSPIATSGNLNRDGGPFGGGGHVFYDDSAENRLFSL